MKPHNYAQLIVKSELVDAGYLAGFFNSSLGHAVRKSGYSGDTIPKLTKTTLAEIDVFLPDRHTQTAVAEAAAQIRNLQNELREIDERLWSDPRDCAGAVEVLRRVNREERFAEWLDSLPYPLASILWTYHTADDDRRKYESLDHFFEALGEFLATVLLSGFQQAEVRLRNEECQKIRRIFDERGLSLRRSSFGTWVRIVERLSKTGRTLLDKGHGAHDADNSPERMFCVSDRRTLERLFDSSLVSVLQEANSLRNDWRGHGGILGDDEAHDRHLRLFNMLTRVRETFGNMWAGYHLVMPRSMELEGGIYSVIVDMVIGRSTPFAPMELKTQRGLEKGHLHLIGAEEPEALQLLPLVRILASPRTAQNACYFYNRQQSDGTRFVSYHFEAESEVVEHDDALDSLTALFSQFEGNDETVQVAD